MYVATVEESQAILNFCLFINSQHNRHVVIGKTEKINEECLQRKNIIGRLGKNNKKLSNRKARTI